MQLMVRPNQSEFKASCVIASYPLQKQKSLSIDIIKIETCSWSLFKEFKHNFYAHDLIKIFPFQFVVQVCNTIFHCTNFMSIYMEILHCKYFKKRW